MSRGGDGRRRGSQRPLPGGSGGRSGHRRPRPAPPSAPAARRRPAGALAAGARRPAAWLRRVASEAGAIPPEGPRSPIPAARLTASGSPSGPPRARGGGTGEAGADGRPYRARPTVARHRGPARLGASPGKGAREPSPSNAPTGRRWQRRARSAGGARGGWAREPLRRAFRGARDPSGAPGRRVPVWRPAASGWKEGRRLAWTRERAPNVGGGESCRRPVWKILEGAHFEENARF